MPIVLLTRQREMTAAQTRRSAASLGNVTMLERAAASCHAGVRHQGRAACHGNRQRAAEITLLKLADKQVQIAQERDRARGYLDVAA